MFYHGFRLLSHLLGLESDCLIFLWVQLLFLQIWSLFWIEEVFWLVKILDICFGLVFFYNACAQALDSILNYFGLVPNARTAGTLRVGLACLVLAARFRLLNWVPINSKHVLIVGNAAKLSNRLFMLWVPSRFKGTQTCARLGLFGVSN